MIQATRIALVQRPSACSSHSSECQPITLPRLPFEDAVMRPDLRPETRPHRAMPNMPAAPARSRASDRLRWVRAALAELREDVV